MAVSFTETLYAAADGPEVRVTNRVFWRAYQLRIVQAPVYGRFLFRPSVVIDGCVFRAGGFADLFGPMLQIGGVAHVS